MTMDPLIVSLQERGCQALQTTAESVEATWRGLRLSVPRSAAPGVLTFHFDQLAGTADPVPVAEIHMKRCALDGSEEVDPARVPVLTQPEALSAWYLSGDSAGPVRQH